MTVCLLPLQLSCGGGVTVFAGDYETQGAELSTATLVEDVDSAGQDCGQLQGGTRRAVERKVFHVSRTESGYSIAHGSGGCVIDARHVGGVLLAEDAACRFSDDAPLVQLGVVQYSFDVFQLDTLAGTVRAAGVAFYDTNSGLTKLCHASELRIVGFSR